MAKQKQEFPKGIKRGQKKQNFDETIRKKNNKMTIAKFYLSAITSTVNYETAQPNDTEAE